MKTNLFVAVGLAVVLPSGLTLAQPQQPMAPLTTPTAPTPPTALGQPPRPPSASTGPARAAAAPVRLPVPIAPPTVREMVESTVDSAADTILDPADVGKIKDKMMSGRQRQVTPSYPGNAIPKPVSRSILIDPDPAQQPRMIRLSEATITSFVFADTVGNPCCWSPSRSTRPCSQMVRPAAAVKERPGRQAKAVALPEPAALQCLCVRQRRHNAQGLPGADRVHVVDGSIQRSRCARQRSGARLEPGCTCRDRGLRRHP